jgi:protocatechuate 3,4-dioxygenase beta subunit
VAAVLAVALGVFLWALLREPENRSRRRKPERSSATRPVRSAVRARLLKAPKGSISGTVKDEKGAPVAGALVCTRARSQQLSSEETRRPVCAKADGEGKYLLAGLLPARYPVAASAPGHIPGRYVGPDGLTFVRVQSGQKKEGVDIVLRGGGVKVNGTVEDVGGGGIPGARVWVRSGRRRAKAYAFALTDDNGKFETWTAPGRVHVTADADGYAENTVRGAAPGQHIKVWLTPESVLAGKVVDAATRRPVPDAKVEAKGSWHDGGRPSRGTAFTDAQGLFRIGGLKPGRYKPVAEAADRYGHARESVLLGLAQTVDDVIIEVYPAHEVKGRVVLADKVTPCSSGGAGLTDKKSGERKWARTESDGRVRFKGVLPGVYTVRVWCRNHLDKDTYPEITVPDDADTEHVWEVGKGAELSGVVVTYAGGPVAGVDVQARPEGSPDPRGKRTYGSDQSDLKGRFKMAGLAAGQYRIEAVCPDDHYLKKPLMLELAAGERKEIRVVVERGGEIHGDVKDETGKPVKGASVRARSKKQWGDWRKNRTYTRDDGTFELKGVRPGKYRMRASTETLRVLRKPGAKDEDVHGEPVTVHAGRISRVHLVVESQDGKISGRVVDQQKNPVPDAYVGANREKEAPGTAKGAARRSMRWTWETRPVITDADGKFEIRGLTPGRYTLRAYRKGGGEAVAENVEVGSKVTLEIKTTGTISGTVTAPAGPPPRFFSIAIRDYKTGYRREERFFETSGEWVVRDLPEGEFVVTVDSPEGTANETVDLAEGQKKENVRLVLEARVTLTGTVVAMDTGDRLPGFAVWVRQVRGDASSRISFRGDQSRRYITDDDGVFEVERAPAGRLQVWVFPMHRWHSSEYAWASTVVTARGGTVHDVGRIEVPRKRLKGKERAADLGFKVQETPPDTDPADRRFIVSYIRPDGPAAYTGLEVGHEIVAVDGRIVTGAKYWLYWSLTRVRAGVTVRLGLKNGQTIFITAQEPP